MKKADEAKEASNKNFTVKFQDEYKSLMTLVESQVEKATASGNKTTKAAMPMDRVSKPVLDAVVAKLKDLGYQVNSKDNSAYQTYNLEVSWK